MQKNMSMVRKNIMMMVRKKKINNMLMITLLNIITLKISRELNNQSHKKVAKNMKIDHLQNKANNKARLDSQNSIDNEEKYNQNFSYYIYI